MLKGVSAMRIRLTLDCKIDVETISLVAAVIIAAIKVLG